jgi:hypothetical protein
VQHKEVETQAKKRARATQPSIFVCAARRPARPTNRARGMRGAVEGKGGIGGASYRLHQGTSVSEVEISSRFVGGGRAGRGGAAGIAACPTALRLVHAAAPAQ